MAAAAAARTASRDGTRLNALKLEMKKAVHQENFERAAELRDQIRSLEAAHKEQKENK